MNAEDTQESSGKKVPDATIARLGSTYFSWLEANPDITSQLRGALHELMLDAGINFDRVDVRVKTWPSLKAKARKLRDDGTPAYPDPWNDIRDIIGARVTVLHSTEIPAVQRLLADQFEVLRSVNKAEETRVSGGFGYGSHHLIVRITDHTEGLEAYAGTVVELQIRTVLQHAWAEFEHDIRYKRVGSGGLDPQVDRAFTLAAGLIELADQQFDQIADIAQPVHSKATGGVEGRAAVADVDAELSPETLPGILTIVLGPRYPVSRVDDYRFLHELLRMHRIDDVAALGELINPADMEAVSHSLEYRFVPGQVRFVDDLLLNRFGTEHIERTAEAGHRPAERRARLTRRLQQLRGAR